MEHRAYLILSKSIIAAFHRVGKQILIPSAVLAKIVMSMPLSPDFARRFRPPHIKSRRGECRTGFDAAFLCFSDEKQTPRFGA
ncbi:MAG TPA: hypothetical protein PKV62_07660, partial [Oscillospiraceae bacterium]|nr:hypothetical protein [Oscillospiraceae bacterium]